jgi:ketosteroid isomerase-like protein
MLGTWSTSITYAPSADIPKGATVEGSEVWRPGPGGFSVIEESHEQNPKGPIDGLGVAWWDAQDQGQRFLWCESTDANGCYVSKEVAKWNNGSLVWSEEQENSGKKRIYSETFTDITANSFTQLLQEGEPGQPLKTTVTIRAKRVAPETMSSDATSDDALRRAMAQRNAAMVAGDSAAVESLTAGDYIQTDISGYVQDKSTWLSEYFRPLAQLIKAGKFRWEVYEEKDVQVRIFGDTAVVTGSMNLKGTGAKPGGHTWVEAPGNTFGGTLRFTRVWINEGDQWRLAALQNNLVQPPK